jgi:hypothetical protein
MLRPIFALWMLACGDGAPSALVEGQAPLPGGAFDAMPPPVAHALTLTGPAALVSGDVATFEVTAPDLAVGERVEIGEGREAGPGRCPYPLQTGGSPCLDITGQVRALGDGVAFDDGGTVKARVAVQITHSVDLFFAQAFLLRGAASVTSNVLPVALEQPYAALEPRVAELEEAVAAHDVAIGEVEGRAADLDAAVAGLSGEVSAAQAGLAGAWATLEDLQDQIAAASASILDAVSGLDALSRSILAHDAAIALLTDDAAQLAGELASLADALYAPTSGLLDRLGALDLGVGALASDLRGVEASADARLDAVEQQVVPVGTVIDWYRPTAETPVPAGWKVMDGTAIDDPQSPMFGVVVPDMSGKFARGVPASDQGAIGASGGANQHDHTVNYTHGHTGGSFSTTVSSSGANTMSGTMSGSGSGTGSGTAVDAGAHSHVWSTTGGSIGEDFISGDGTVLHDWTTTGFGTGLSSTVAGGTRFFPLAAVAPSGARSFSTAGVGNHSHSVSVSSVSVSVSGTASVSGNVSVSGTASSNSVTTPSTALSTTSGAAGNVPAYVGFVKLIRVR